MIKKLLKSALGEINLGWLEFMRDPSKQTSWGGPLNGQRFRQRILFDLLFAVPPKAIVETGTFRGNSTALFAATSLPVYSAEIHPRYFSFSRSRFIRTPNVHIYHSDSRSFLRQLRDDGRVPKDDVFFYLDAHWEDDLPLREEVDIIFSTWANPIIMIDDFQVPGASYYYDDYGPGKALTLEYLWPVVLSHNIAVFFPSVDSPEETGKKRGTAVLCTETTAAKIGETVKTLVRHSPRPIRLQET